ncbi:MAG TPA: acyl-CoA dehydratase activase [Deltaproteobacteria bacterium]|nr:acyl-CoA dehydratase activase [Deltaproteobacteria bacterium]
MGGDVLGIDVGSTAAGVVQIDGHGRVVRSAYGFHRGNIAGTLEGLISRFPLGDVGYVACTSSCPPTADAVRRSDDTLASLRAARHLHGDIGALLCVGAERFSLHILDEKGRYRSTRTNTSCAAGTGSFLDQQARRLGLKDSAHLDELASGNKGAVPLIASRCAVFAKTDLVHAQQSGFSPMEIADGLCRGLAVNIAETLFHGVVPEGTIVFCGGVSKNTSVKAHLESLIQRALVVDDLSHLYGALGAALMLLDELGRVESASVSSIRGIFTDPGPRRSLHYAPLELKRSSYPDFKGLEHREFVLPDGSFEVPVEVDVYEDLGGRERLRVTLGLDIGSTSTKSVILGDGRRVIVGFYTRTSGRPVDAVRAILGAVEDLCLSKGVTLEFTGAAATGSGRKLIGAIIGADMTIDEITAHARAAIETNPRADTIIEIGGQDAKFTRLEGGAVTFCAMNTVCAAGTGSFIEEQASRLGCPLAEVSERALGRGSPASSDRCTVFMERDLNHLLSLGYEKDEVLAAALHAVRENYLTKVAVQSMIGEEVCFQGATAKNAALVAAFEQRLERPIFVSKYPHLTGALGAALILDEEHSGATAFRGTGIHKRTIELCTEVCTICANHCKLTVAEIDGQTVASGFLCGREYDSKAGPRSNPSGFDLMRERKRAFSRKRPKTYTNSVVIGLPDALHMSEDIEFWRFFFDRLGVRTVTRPASEARHRGRAPSVGAEFCMPVRHLFDSVWKLLPEVDHVFLPVYLEDEDEAQRKGARRQYCYVTQYAPSLVALRLAGEAGPGRILTPVVEPGQVHVRTTMSLYKALRPVLGAAVSLFDLKAALDEAVHYRERARRRLLDVYKRGIASQAGGDISVVLLGRPYTVLCSDLNKGVADIFASQGVRVFYQDMVSQKEAPSSWINAMLQDVPWRYAAGVLEAASAIAHQEGVYPVLVTSFRCTPDTMTLECFKRIMHESAKPYLVIQLDGHDSKAGYETRIEAAVRSFRNHHRLGRGPARVRLPDILPSRSLRRPIVYIPDWDRFSCRLLAANLRREGLDARLLEHSSSSVTEGLRYNTGQCIPIHIIAQEYMDTMRRHDVDPQRCALWIPRGEIPCNLKLIPHHIKAALQAHGHGMERAEVYHGELSMIDLSVRASFGVYFSFMFGGLMRRVGCRIRPYETEKGATDRAIRDGMDILEAAFASGSSKAEALRKAVSAFKSIPVSRQVRPKVAIVGDLYVRDNDFLNQDLITFLEERGAEAVTMPYTTYARMVAGPYLRKWVHEGKYLFALSSAAMLAAFRAMEMRYYGIFREVLDEPEPTFTDNPARILAAFGLTTRHSGESMDNVLKVHYLSKHYSDIGLLVLVNPAFCCAGLVTEAMADRIEQVTGIPVANIVYDGTGGTKNSSLVPVLAHLRSSASRAADLLGLAG